MFKPTHQRLRVLGLFVKPNRHPLREVDVIPETLEELICCRPRGELRSRICSYQIDQYGRRLVIFDRVERNVRHLPTHRFSLAKQTVIQGRIEGIRIDSSCLRVAGGTQGWCANAFHTVLLSFVETLTALVGQLPRAASH